MEHLKPTPENPLGDPIWKSPGHIHTCLDGHHEWVHSTNCTWDIVHPCFEHYIRAGVEYRESKLKVGKDLPTVENEKGAKQSDIHYRMDLLPTLALFAEAKVLKEGAQKYGEWNWINIPINEHLNHLLIHVYAYLAGDKQDDHLSHIACRAHFALELQERGEK